MILTEENEKSLATHTKNDINAQQRSGNKQNNNRNIRRGVNNNRNSPVDE